MLMAQARSCATGNLRRILVACAISITVLYGIILFIGALIPIQFLISFELLLIITAPIILFFIVLNSWRYAKFKRRMDLALLGTWAWLIMTIAAYFLYLISGLTVKLWSQKLWFSENDVLHIGLIIWMIYIALVVAPLVKDESPTS